MHTLPDYSQEFMHNYGILLNITNIHAPQYGYNEKVIPQVTAHSYCKALISGFPIGIMPV